MAKKPKTTIGFILSLVGGLLILLYGVIIAIFGNLMTILALTTAGITAYFFTSLIYAVGATAIIAGLLVLLGSVFMRNPKRKTTGGVIVIVFSALALLVGGGFLVGSVLGIIGGALAVAKK